MFFSSFSLAGETLQRDDRGRQGLRQCQQTLCEWHQGPVAAVQEGGDDIGEKSCPQSLKSNGINIPTLSLRGHSCDSPHE